MRASAGGGGALSLPACALAEELLSARRATVLPSAGATGISDAGTRKLAAVEMGERGGEGWAGTAGCLEELLHDSPSPL